MRKKYIFVGILVLMTTFLSGCGFKDSVPEGYKVELEVWGVFDDSGVYSKFASEYQKINPYVTLKYRKLAPDTYKEDLIDALAAGKGPDIFMIRNSWRAFFEDKTAPAPDGLFNEREYRDALVDVVASDFIGSENKIYAIPTTVDSLALYYNKDLFNAAGITRPPETWDEIIEMSRKINVLDQFGSIIRSGIALGTGLNINRASDILTVMMMQREAMLGNTNKTGGSTVNFSNKEGQEALDYYIQFSRLGSPAYSWNARQHYSIDAFYEGTIAMMINYSWQYETIKQKNAKLNIGIATLPQFDRFTPVNLANYWGYAVAKNKTIAPPNAVDKTTVPVNAEKQNYLRTFESWQFLKFMAMPHENNTMTLYNALTGTTKLATLSFDPALVYAEETRKPAARRDIVAQQQQDLVLAPFASGNLIAKNWYQGNPEAAEGILIDMIENVVRGEKTTAAALSAATNRINLLKR